MHGITHFLFFARDVRDLSLKTLCASLFGAEMNFFYQKPVERETEVEFQLINEQMSDLIKDFSATQE